MSDPGPQDTHPDQPSPPTIETLHRTLSLWNSPALGFAMVSPVVGLYAVMLLPPIATRRGETPIRGRQHRGALLQHFTRLGEPAIMDRFRAIRQHAEARTASSLSWRHAEPTLRRTAEDVAFQYPSVLPYVPPPTVAVAKPRHGARCIEPGVVP